MQMYIQTERARKALHAGHRANMQRPHECDTTLRFGGMAHIALHGAIENRDDFQANVGIESCFEAQCKRQRQRPLTYRDMRQQRIHPLCRTLGHPACTARWAKPALFAAKRHQVIEGAMGAAQTQKSVCQDPTAQECINFATTESGMTPLMLRACAKSSPSGFAACDTATCLRERGAARARLGCRRMLVASGVDFIKRAKHAGFAPEPGEDA